MNSRLCEFRYIQLLKSQTVFFICHNSATRYRCVIILYVSDVIFTIDIVNIKVGEKNMKKLERNGQRVRIRKPNGRVSRVSLIISQ